MHFCMGLWPWAGLAQHNSTSADTCDGRDMFIQTLLHYSTCDAAIRNRTSLTLSWLRRVTRKSG